MRRFLLALSGLLLGACGAASSVKDMFVAAESCPEDKVTVGEAPTGEVLVSAVTPDFPAAKAGFVQGDIIVEVDHRPIVNAADMIPPPGSPRVASHLVRVRRGDTSVELTLDVPH